MSEETIPYGPGYLSNRSKIISYGCDEHVLALWVEMPDGRRETHEFALPHAQIRPDELRITGVGVHGRHATGYEHLRYVGLTVEAPGEFFIFTYDIDSIIKFQWFVIQALGT